MAWSWFIILVFDNFDFYFLSNCLKSFSNINVILGTGLEERYPILLSNLLALGGLHHSVLHIALIPNQQFADIITRLFVNLFHPALYIFKGFPVIHSICQNYTSGSFVVSLSNCFKTLLPGSIPNLHFNLFVINLENFDLEINTYGSQVRLYKLVFHELEENAGFSYC